MPDLHSDTAGSLLDEIRQLFADDDKGDALDLLDAYLDAHPTDLEATLLKIDLSLEARRNSRYVGETMTRLITDHPTSEQVQHTRARVEEQVRTLVNEGRRELRRSYYRDADTRFEMAMTIAPQDPAVPLAAALAVLGDEADSSSDTPDSPLDLFREVLGRTIDKNTGGSASKISEYLERAIKIGPPEHPACREAVGHLLRQMLAMGRIDQAMDILAQDEVSSGQPSPLAAEIAVRAVIAALAWAEGLLRAGQWPAAEELLTACASLIPDLVLVVLLQAEERTLSGDHAAARAHYERALALSAQPSALPPLDGAAEVWRLAQAHKLACPHCGKEVNGQAATCAFCDRPVGEHKLLGDRYPLERLPAAVAARIGLAELIAAQGEFSEAIEHLDAAMANMPGSHVAARSLRSLRGRWVSEMTHLPETEPPGQVVLASWQRDGLTLEVQAQVRYLCEVAPTSWQETPVEMRRALTQALLGLDDLTLARMFLESAYEGEADNALLDLRSTLTAAVAQQVAALTTQAREALADNQPESALAQTEAALALVPHDVPSLLLRADALLALDNPLAALAAYRMALNHATDPTTGHAARLGIACALEKRYELGHALIALDDLDDPLAHTIRERIARRQRGEPVVLVRSLADMVMHDTLERVDTGPYHAGYFAVTVGAVRRPTETGGWSERILAASLEFTQILGGLRHQEGDPIFALRLISHPDPRIPERGSITAALVTRVTAPDAEACRALAQELWDTMRAILPLTHEFVYGFEPVVDEEALTALLDPFDPTILAEIVRREDMQQEESRYAVYPFIPASIDLHNLCWMLLRQPAPAMLSVHLLPTDIMPWEAAALNRLMVDEPRLAAQEMGEVSSMDPVWAWWHGAKIWGQTQTNRRLVEALRAQAYILGITVMGSAKTSALLPEMAAAALFGPFRDDGDITRGGYEIVRAAQDEELAAAHRNVTRLDVERWTYTSAPHGAVRLHHLVGDGQAALVFRLPIPGPRGIPGLPSLDVKPIAPPSNLPTRGTLLGESVVRVSGMPLAITQAQDDRRRHTYIVGKTGTGKSTLIKYMAVQDIENGHGVCVIDPHGDLVEDILRHIPAHRLNDVVLFDPSDEERPIGLNLLHANSEPEKHRIATEFIGLLVRMYDPSQQGIVGPRFQHNVRNAMLTVMALDGSTLIEVVRALTDIDYVRQVLPHVTDPLVRNYWEKQIANTSDFHKSEILDYIVSKFSRFVGDQLVRNIIGQRQTTIDFRQIMDRKQILLVNLSKGKIGPESAQFLGLLLVQRLLLTALSRSDVPPDQRPDFFLYVDEFQNFATELFATILSEGRKYGVAVTMANQYLTQLDHTIREAVFGNVGSIISFRLGMQDAAALAPELYPVFGIDDLLNLPKFTTCVKLLVDGLASSPFTMKTVLDSRVPNSERAEVIRALSRQRYGRDVASVSEDVLARFAPMGK